MGLPAAKRLRRMAPEPPFDASRDVLVAHHYQALGAGFAAPGLAGPSRHLADVGWPLVAGEGGIAFRGRVEALDRVRRPVSRPHPILIVHEDGVRAGLALRHREVRP